ncbi:uncharacterized protein [Argopecten irradians]|uniref:uncharacterized protein n=1 Tax=Argopecten irradians TaxID=31199 RepID=UPI00371846BC
MMMEIRKYVLRGHNYFFISSYPKGTCSWEDRWCWPGNCGNSNYAKDCQCESPSFTTVVDDNQSRCQLAKVPEVLTCRMMVIDTNNDALMSHIPPNSSSHCSNQGDFYGNLQVDRIVTNTSFELLVNVTHVPKPDYVTNHAFGVTDVDISIVIKTITGGENTIKTTNLHSDPQSNDPKHLMSFDTVINNERSAGHLSNGQRLCLRFIAHGGGHLISKNIISDDHDESLVPFSKTRTTKDLCYHFDDAHPVHCLETDTCVSEPLDVGSRILTNRNFQVIVNGWDDPTPVPGNLQYASGIDTYSITVYGVKEAGPGQIEMSRTPVVNIHVNASQSIAIRIPDNLPNPAMYGIVLDVKDVANNVKHARRFVIFDNSSEILTREDNHLYSTTGAASTGYKWQTNPGDLCYSWKDRYHNDKLKVLLRPIQPDHHGHFTGIYEQISGILPVSGTENVDGITEFYFSLSNDTSVLFVNETVQNFTSQKICLSLPLQDGETYRLDIVAKDIVNHTFSEHIYTHVDSSEPEIFDIGLEKDGYKLLNVHNSSDLSKMILKFNALDIHSGLYSVDWSLGTTFGGHDIGNGSLGIARLGPNEICPEYSNCYCPSVGVCAYYNFSLSLNSLVHLNTHNGNHNRVYHFTLSVTNDARLSFVEHKEVLADDSPPAVGVVSEGSVVGEDIDYTSEETVTVHWDGFIDHESGIHSYKVGVGNSCLDKDAFGGINNSDVTLHDETSIITTTFQSARVTLAAEGQYFVTVVAYNNAMESSDPVCSDGIVLDKTPPLITNVTLKSATSTGCMVCSEGTAWYITRNLTKYKVSDGHCDELCRNTTVNEFLSLLPVEGLQPSQTKPCFISDGHGTIYLPIDLIDLQWDVIDTGSQIRDVYIGVGSTEYSSLSPDLIDYHISSHTDYYKSRHVGLSDGDEIYIFVKITNTAALTSTASIGPVIVDETPPVCPPSLPVLIQNGSLYIYWSGGAIADEEQKEPISTFLYRVGRQGEYVSLFKQMGDSDADTCVVKGQICVNIPLPELHVYDSDLQLTFTIQLHVFNHAGYHCTVNTDNFYLPSQNPPGHGVVYDVLRNDGGYADGIEDIDVSVSLEEFCVTWEGFSHVGDMTHELGIGEVPGTDDTIPFHEVPNRKLYCENATNLSHYRRYFVTVRAITSGGSTDTISDGFTVINPMDIMTSLRVFDGNGCAGKIGTPVEQKFGTVNIYTPSKINLHIGHTYSLVSNASLTIDSAEAIVTVHTTINLVNYYQFLPLIAKPQFKVASDTNRSFSLHILNCVPDVDSQISRDIASLYWNQGKLSSYVSHYEVEFLSLAEGTGEPLVIDFTTVSGHLNSFSFGTVNLVKGRYFFALRQCVEYTCFDWVKTNGFALIDHLYEGFSMSSWMNRTGPECSDIQLTIADLQCSNGVSGGMDKSVAIRWGIFRDKDLKIQLTDWNLYIIESNSTTVELSTCQKLPLYPHVKMQTCVEVFCPEGSMGSRCGPLIVTEDPNVFDKHQLYEVDSDADDIRHNKELFYASNIGDKLAWLHGSELDFTGKSFRPGGVILGMGDRAITWYLLRNTYNFTQPCEVNPDCVATVETVGGLSAFQGINLDFEIVYYICAVTTIVKDDIPSVQTCGNGFVVDITPPVVGDVIFTSDNGFITQESSLIIHWDGFQDFDGYRTLGYPSSIARFTYSVGSNPYAQDVVPETDVGLYHSARVNNPTLIPGVTYYVTVTAFDHVGHQTTAVSNGVMFDNTPPVTGTISVGTYLKQSDIVSEEITVHWTGVRDNESGISKTRLGVGSSKHQPDVINYQDCSGEFASLSDLETLHDGHSYYVILPVTNGAELSSATASDEFVMDRSSPARGVVKDGLLEVSDRFAPAVGIVRDGLLEVSDRFAPAVGIVRDGLLGVTDRSSPAVGIVRDGLLEVGDLSSPAVDIVKDGLLEVSDRSASTMGIVRDGLLEVSYRSAPAVGIIRDGLLEVSDRSAPARWDCQGWSSGESQWISNFIPGMTYYCTVQACNGAGLCTSVSSNGFITDNSPPLPGIVHVGINGHHSRFWPHPDSIQMQWFGFVDVESKIQNYEVCVRHTNNSDCDILTFTNVFLSNTVTLPVTLPERVSLSVEVRANNPLDMSTRSVSDTFIVDTTPPVVLSPPVLGRENTNTNVTVQIDPTVVMMNWKFEDQDSPIVKQIIRMRAHADGHTPIENVYLSGETSHIITLDPKHPLKPGDTYTAVVTACNEAALCTSSTSNGLLIDPTPPHQGGIIEPIPWHLSPNANETKSFVNLTLYGFKDLESGIGTYYVTVGNTYSGSEISDGILTFISSESDDDSEKFQLTLNGRLHSGQQMVLSVWADNNAGLFSSISRVTVTVIASDNKNTFGYLEILKHSCDAAYCNKDCTCAVISQKCHSVEVDVDCTESNYTDDFDMNINIQHDGKYNDQEVLTSSACISAAWTVSGTQKHVIKRMEWSMGQQGMAVGTGIFDPLLENLWYDVGQKTSVTYCLRGGKSLLHDTKYVVYVRSWTSTSHYTVFTSHPVHIDNTAPSVRRGKYIIENSNKTCSRDVDFTSTLATISSCWTGVFTDPQSGIHSYQVALGTIPGGDDLVSNMNIGLNTLMSWSDLSLSPGTNYYVTVTCLNNVGIQQTLVSDGFVVDNEHPYAGIVYNTDRYHNAHVHNSRDIGVSFRGFHDRHSAITRFSVAYEILDKGLVKDNIGLEFADIGFQTSFVFYNTSLVTGQWFRFAVKAKDSAGFESNIVYSPPALLDSTPPVHVKISSVSEVDNITSVNGTVYWTKYLGHPGPTVYKLYIASSNMTSFNEFEVSFENNKQIHSVSLERGGIYSAAISLVTSPFYDGNRSLSVLAYDIPINTTVDITLSVSDSITETGLTDDVVAVHQVSLTELNINTDIMDLESGMREIYVGAGSSKGGFQLHPLKRVPTSYNTLLPVDAPHGQAVHVTVTAVNQAGTWSHFYSSSLLMDHTPPSITNASMSIAYKDFGDRILTKVKVRWEVIEDESSEVACSCEISKNKATRMLHYGNSETELETPFLVIDHGTDISARITCFNIANLQESILVGPETVTLFAPNVSDARISFDTALATSSGLPVIQSSSGVMFSWEIPHGT